MKIITDENIKEIHVREVLQLFYPDEYKELEMKLYLQGNFVYLEYKENIYKEEVNISLKNATKKVVYKTLQNYTNKSFPYGILTGVKPINILDLYKNKSKKETEKILKKDYFVSEDKINLLIETKKLQNKIINNNLSSLYIHIPFCPKKCSYCSFPSKICSKDDDILKKYTKYLIKELESISNVIDKENILLDSVYIGGGTPGILNENLTKKLTFAVNNYIIKSKNIEFTYELGRADLVTTKKLDILKEHNVNRICINPQSLDENVLKSVNRDITNNDFFNSINILKKYDFIINSDLIMGLDTNNINSSYKDVKTLIDLNIDNITMHTLSLKRASDISNINFENDDFYETQKRCFDLLKNNQYTPYYLYKQKQSLCMGENVGFAKPGTSCIYNIKTMKNKSTVLSIGAGGSGKVYSKKENKTYRVDTTKDTNIYIKEIDNIIKRKEKEYALYLRKK